MMRQLTAVLAALLLAASPAGATPMNGLPAATGINPTDTIPACQVASGCGASNPLVQMPMAAVTGNVGSAIGSATTIGAAQNNETIPVTSSGYAITFPGGGSVLAAGTRVTLVAAPGAAVAVCVQSGSVFDTNSAAPLVAGIGCASGNGVTLAGGETLAVVSEGSNYYAALANAGAIGIEAAKTANYTVAAADAGKIIPLACTGTGCTITMPLASSFPAGQWVEIVTESGTTDNDIATTSPSTIYGVPNNISLPGTIDEVPGMGTLLVSDGTNWFATQWITLSGDDSSANTSFTADVWDCYQPRHLTASTAITVTIPTGLPAGCVLNMVQEGTGQVEIVAGSGFTLHAFDNDAHSAGQYATFFVEIEAGGAVGILGGNIVP